MLLQAWTLIHELMFYGIFLAYFFVSRRVFIGLVLVWMLAIVAVTCVGTPGVHGMTDAWFGRLFALINLEFMLGMACALWLRSNWAATWGMPLAVAGTVAFAILLAWLPHAQPAIEASRLLFGCAFAAVIVGLAAHETMEPRRVWRPLVWLGDSSYSQYLVHFTVASVMVRVLKRVLAPEHALLAVCLCVLAVIPVTALYHQLFERRAIPAVRRLLLQRGVIAR